MRVDTARIEEPATGLATLGRTIVFAAFLSALMSVASPALAQRDDPGLQLNCANDFFRLCAGVDPQSSEADACMNRNRGRLSGACKAAINTYEGGAPAKRGRSKE